MGDVRELDVRSPGQGRSGLHATEYSRRLLDRLVVEQQVSRDRAAGGRSKVRRTLMDEVPAQPQVLEAIRVADGVAGDAHDGGNGLTDKAGVLGWHRVAEETKPALRQRPESRLVPGGEHEQFRAGDAGAHLGSGRLGDDEVGIAPAGSEGADACHTAPATRLPRRKGSGNLEPGCVQVQIRVGRGAVQGGGELSVGHLEHDLGQRGHPSG